MPTYAQLSAQLLRDAAKFFQTIGSQNEPLKDQMDENARVYNQLADLVENDPTGIVGEEEEEGQQGQA